MQIAFPYYANASYLEHLLTSHPYMNCWQLMNGNDLSIHPPPSFKNCGDDLTVLKSIPNGPKMIEGLRAFVREFTETYVYLPGYTDHTVEKICQMCSKAAQELCIYDSTTTNVIGWTDIEKKIIKERTENLVMGMLHNKIWIQSLPGFLSAEDSNLEALSIAYCRDTFALGKYGISHQLASMPRKYLTGAIASLQQLDADHECYRIVSHHYDEDDEDEGIADPAAAVINLKPALTPVEKLKCVRDTLDRISQAAEKYLLDMSMVNEAHEACVTTDQLIPLAMFVLIHARIPRLASMIFYMEHFSFDVGKNSDLNFALVTFKAAVEFLKDDPLGLSEVCSISSISSTSSTILRITPYSRKRSSSLSTSVTSPLSTPSCSAAMIGSRSINQRPMSPPCYFEGGSDILIQPITNLREVRHRKSVSADLCSLARHATGHEIPVIDHNRITSPLSRRESPNLIVRSRLVLPKTPPPPEPSPSPRRKSSDWTASDQLHENFQPDGKSMYPHPLVSTTSPTISARENFMANCDRPPAYDTCQNAITYMSRRTATRPTSMIIGSPPPRIINVQNNQGIHDRYPRRPRSFCLESGIVQKEHSIGDFLSGLQNLGGDVVGERTGEIRSLQRW
ncbi:hypothetical protein INT44_005381 [Umbelopsis vinacea]|uniref:VPS9 domain-containing protein n=1 Tax=Umbelopsis vinacea TaxID=44442 RepID=A0A8H7Q8D5_9FUNG|nr:hypothetical protein INT44_005381 [Umbelopsis vinacea]